MRHSFASILVLVSLSSAQIKEPKPGMNLFSKEQDIQLGKETAAEIEKQYEVIKDPGLQRYIDNVGQRLTRSKRASDFPYMFKVVADDSINAFALPGGPMFIHTGLIKAAENEAQLAGVMSHEISHVALRHGTNQASKANMIKLPAALGGQMAGNGILGAIAQTGIGLGANSVLLSFSRTAETQADTNGTLILSDAGYNPVEMARFFEKLEADGAKQSKVAEFFSSHPNPGNRVKSVQALVAQLPTKQYTNGDQAAFNEAQKTVQKLPPPKPRAKPEPKPQQPQQQAR
jgi:predicted Zn-dependent protease